MRIAAPLQEEEIERITTHLLYFEDNPLTEGQQLKITAHEDAKRWDLDPRFIHQILNSLERADVVRPIFGL